MSWRLKEGASTATAVPTAVQQIEAASRAAIYRQRQAEALARGDEKDAVTWRRSAVRAERTAAGKARPRTASVRYEAVNAQWPAGKLPKLTPIEAERSARKLYRFAFKRPFKGTVKLARGGVYSKLYGRGFGSSGDVLIIGAAKGWHAHVHTLSHWFHRRINRGKPEHGSVQASLEQDMIAYAVKHDWLSGSLKPKEKAKPVTAKPSLAETRQARREAALKRAEHRLELAQKAIKRLRPEVIAGRRRLAKRAENAHV